MRSRLLVPLFLLVVFTYIIFHVHEYKENAEILDYNTMIKEYKIVYQGNDVPNKYYFRDCNGYNTNLNELKKAVSLIKLPHKYVKDYFDCSQASSYVQWFLQNNCFNAVIGVNWSENHAWVIVYNITDNPNGVIIESTVPKIIDSTSLITIGTSKYRAETESNIFGITKVYSDFSAIIKSLDDTPYHQESKVEMINNDWIFYFTYLPHGNYSVYLISDGRVIKEANNNNNIIIYENNSTLYGNVSYFSKFRWWNFYI